MKRLVCSILLALTFSAQAENWPRFRGPNGSGTSSAKIPAEWKEEQIQWKVKLPGTGHGSPVVWGDRIFILVGNEKTGERQPTCIGADGKTLWSVPISGKSHKNHKFNSLASSTPAVDAKRAVFTWKNGQHIALIAFDHEGKKLWEADAGPSVGNHGFAASPVIYDDLVILNRDQKTTGALIAYDLTTGKERWSIPRKSQRISYSCPCKIGDQLVFVNWQHGFTGVDPKQGKVLWDRSAFDTTTNERAISSPVVAGDLVIGTCGFTQNPKHCVAVRPKADGTAEEVWRIEKAVPHIPSPLVMGDRVFLWDDKAIVTCVEAQTGKKIWQARAPGTVFFGSPVLADDKLFCIDRDGLVVVIGTGDEFELLATNKLEELCRTTPAIANGTMYVRTWEHLIAVR